MSPAGMASCASLTRPTFVDANVIASEAKQSCGDFVMSITVAVVAQGSMGAGVGSRLHEKGAEVRTLLSGRSAASAERARAAGMKPAPDEKALLEGADFFLSILPPGEAENL